jgi:hypothetical protein
MDVYACVIDAVVVAGLTTGCRVVVAAQGKTAF